MRHRASRVPVRQREARAGRTESPLCTLPHSPRQSPRRSPFLPSLPISIYLRNQCGYGSVGCASLIALDFVRTQGNSLATDLDERLVLGRIADDTHRILTPLNLLDLLVEQVAEQDDA